MPASGPSGARAVLTEREEKAGAAIASGDTATAGRAFTRFAALTMINPLTALYFVAVATGHSSQAGTAGVAFLGGVCTASLLWQLLLVTAGALAYPRIPPEARAWTFNIGYGLVGLYALKLAWPLP
ncbi:hypothetical protein GCM10010517_78500 [Streptosporangium fragile]|uniref:LysE type translocator n=1 Tax=Streptosporangium fragile TaxID=46186 RepID=A0ABN3WET0_9ACTN